MYLKMHMLDSSENSSSSFRKQRPQPGRLHTYTCTCIGIIELSHFHLRDTYMFSAYHKHTYRSHNTTQQNIFMTIHTL